MDKSSIILDVQGFSKEGINPIPKEVLEEKIIKSNLMDKLGFISCLMTMNLFILVKVETCIIE